MSDDLQQQLDLLRAEIAQRERQAALLREEIGEMERDLDTFQKRYDKIIVPMQQRLEVIRAAIDDLRGQQRRAQNSAYTPDYSSIGQGYVPVEEQFRRAWAKPPEDGDNPKADTRPNPAIKADAPDLADRIKRLYRELARRFHPDLTPDPEERTRRTALMREINAAYTAGDMDALQAIAEHPADALDQPMLALTLRSVRQQLTNLIAQVDVYKRERDELFYGAMMKLKLDDKLAKMKGRDLLMEMRVEMEREYDQLLQQLDQLRGG
ncbi:MAG: hypothetical protein U0670_22105 [Anaerolineae bacterium]